MGGDWLFWIFMAGLAIGLQVSGRVSHRLGDAITLVSLFGIVWRLLVWERIQSMAQASGFTPVSLAVEHPLLASFIIVLLLIGVFVLTRRRSKRESVTTLKLPTRQAVQDPVFMDHLDRLLREASRLREKLDKSAARVEEDILNDISRWSQGAAQLMELRYSGDAAIIRGLPSGIEKYDREALKGYVATAVGWSQKRKVELSPHRLIPAMTTSADVQRLGIPLAFTTENQRVLVETLGKYANEYTRVQLLMASMQQKPLADSLAAIFNLARWQTDLVNVALEQQRHQYYEGIEVFGYNEHLAESVAAAMRMSGLPGARAIVGRPEVQSNSLKWNPIQNRLKITVGHGNT